MSNLEENTECDDFSGFRSIAPAQPTDAHVSSEALRTELLSTVPPSSLSKSARRSETVAILAVGIVRMKSRVAIPDSGLAEEPAKLPAPRLEVSAESVLRVTNLLNDK